MEKKPGFFFNFEQSQHDMMTHLRISAIVLTDCGHHVDLFCFIKYGCNDGNIDSILPMIDFFSVLH